MLKKSKWIAALLAAAMLFTQGAALSVLAETAESVTLGQANLVQAREDGAEGPLLAENKLRVENTGDAITVSGKASGAAGKFVTILILDSHAALDTIDETNIKTFAENIGQTVTDESGNFSYRFQAKNLEEITELEEYTVYVGVASVDKQFWGEYFYVSAAAQNNFVEKLNQADEAGMKALIDDEENMRIIVTIGLLLDDYRTLEEAGRSRVIKMVAEGKKGGNYTTETLKTTFNGALAAEKINQSKTQQETADLLEDYCSIVGIKTVDDVLYSKVEADKQSFIDKLVYTNKPYSGIEELLTQFHTADFLYRLNNENYDKVEGILDSFKTVLKLESKGAYQDYLDLNNNQKTEVNKAVVDASRNDFTTLSQFIDALAEAVADVESGGGSGGSGGGSNGSGSSGGSSGGGKGGNTVTAVDGQPSQQEGKRMFNDLDTVPWAVEAIEALAKDRIVAGSDGAFYPNREITREEFVKMIVLAFDLYDDTATCQFEDVPATSWSYQYIASAVKYDIVTGYDRKQFGTQDKITREQVAVILHRVTERAGIVLSEENTASFSDADEISEFAADSVTALSRAGIINGVGDGCFAPKATAKRAEAAKIIYGILQQ